MAYGRQINTAIHRCGFIRQDFHVHDDRIQANYERGEYNEHPSTFQARTRPVVEKLNRLAQELRAMGLKYITHGSEDWAGHMIEVGRDELNAHELLVRDNMD